MGAARGWGEGNGKSVPMGSEMPLCKIKTVSGTGGGNDGTAIPMSFVPKNYTLKRVKPVYFMSCVFYS